MLEALQVLLGALVLIGFWWGVFALIRLVEPTPRSRTPYRAAAHGEAPAPARPDNGRPSPWTSPRDQPQPRAVPCCPDCAPDCQTYGLAFGRAWGHGDSWLAAPFGEDGINIEAAVFWGDDCCPDCWKCPICNGQSRS